MRAVHAQCNTKKLYTIMLNKGFFKSGNIPCTWKRKKEQLDILKDQYFNIHIS